MTPLAPMTTELADLLESHCLGELSPDEARRLDELVRTDEACCRHYILFMQMHALAERFDGGMEEGAGMPVASGQWLVASDPPSDLRPPPSIIPPIIIDSSPARHSPVGGFIFSHIAAAVILGIGLLVGLAWRISLPTPENQEPGGTGYASAVGRITALADCKARQWSVASAQWSEITNHKLEIINHNFSLGDRFTLFSGLMEITYDTGAKVILEGPCTYDIDSKRGGYLAVGKLTAKVDKRAEGGKRRADKADHYQLSTINYQLFSVRTPTAVVTDLGTEFGVEVEESGATRSHVFQGSVEVRSSNSWRLATSGEPVQILHAGQSARVERGRNSKVAIIREPGQPDRFVRQISKSPNQQISKSQSPGPRSLAPRYRLIDLGTLGGDMSCATAMNAGGQVVGESRNATGVIHAFFYADGQMMDLNTLRGGISCAYGVNVVGQVVGRSGPSDSDCRAFLFCNGVMKDLGTLGGSAACAMAINDIGHIAGYSRNSSGVTRAFLRVKGGSMQDLGALGGPNARSWANSLNSKWVVGYSETKNGPTHAFRYHTASGMEDIGMVVGARASSEAMGVNAAGLVVGWSKSVHEPDRGFLYRNDDGMARSIFLGEAGSVAYAINNEGQIVGSIAARNGLAEAGRAFLCDNGIMCDLNSLIAPTSGWTLMMASDINDSGQIIGNGRAPDGAIHAYMLTPVKEGQKARNER